MNTKRLDIELGKALNIQPKMVRFYANRLMIELALGKQISRKMQKKIFNRSKIGLLESVFNKAEKEGDN